MAELQFSIARLAALHARRLYILTCCTHIASDMLHAKVLDHCQLIIQCLREDRVLVGSKPMHENYIPANELEHAWLKDAGHEGTMLLQCNTHLRAT